MRIKSKTLSTWALTLWRYLKVFLFQQRKISMSWEKNISCRHTKKNKQNKYNSEVVYLTSNIDTRNTLLRDKNSLSEKLKFNY